MERGIKNILKVLVGLACLRQAPFL